MLAAVTAYVNQYEIDFQAAKARDAANAALKITDTQITLYLSILSSFHPFSLNSLQWLK